MQEQHGGLPSDTVVFSVIVPIKSIGLYGLQEGYFQMPLNAVMSDIVVFHS